jgi:hypothetical protein
VSPSSSNLNPVSGIHIIATAYPRIPSPERPEQGVQNRKQSRVDEQRLRVADYLVEDVHPQGFQIQDSLA